MDRFKQIMLELDEANHAVTQLTTKHAEEMAKIARSDDAQKLSDANEQIVGFENQIHQYQLQIAELQTQHAEALKELDEWRQKDVVPNDVQIQNASELA